MVAECQGREAERLNHRQNLRQKEQSALVEALRGDSRERREQARGELPRERDDPKPFWRVSQAIDEPGQGDELHVCADEREDLPDEEQPEVPVLQASQR